MNKGGKHRTLALDNAHVLIKEALTSQPDNLELRALYTYYFVETGQHKLARDFAVTTLRSFARHDVYALFAAGYLTYTEAREIREQTKDALKTRSQKFARAAEYYEKALQISPQCAFAAQGLAIAIAENTIGTGVDAAALVAANGSANSGSSASSSVLAMQKNTKDALTILSKVKDSINDGSVYINIGHCHFLREEYDKAIENVSLLLPDLPKAGADRVWSFSTKRRRLGISRATVCQHSCTSLARGSTRPTKSRTLPRSSAPSSRAKLCVDVLPSCPR